MTLMTAALHSTNATSFGTMHMLIMHTINHYRESGSSTGSSLCVMSWLTTSGMSMMRLSVITLLTLLCSIAEQFMLYVTVST